MSGILAIDQSTSGTKAILFDHAGQILDQTNKEHHQYYPYPGWVEHDAEEIYRNTIAVVSELVRRNPALKTSLEGISLTNQRETVVVFERDGGRPLSPAIVWQCRRGVDICANLNRQGYDSFVQSRTGLKLDTYFSASKLAWLCDHDPEIARRLRDGSALVGTIDTYLIYRFTEGRVFATEPTNACRTLLYDIHRLCWDEDLCGLFGIPLQALAEVRTCDAHYGETRLEGCLERATPICGVMGDSQAALFAQRCFKAGAVKMTLGSGTSVLVNSGETAPDPAEGIVSTVAWITHTGLVYALEGIINFSGATISWMKNQLGLIDTSTETEALALSVESSAGVYLVPAFVGMGAPHWAPNARAAILGLTPQATRAHVVRAGLEAIGYQIKDVLDWINIAGVHNSTSDIHADGGAVRNRFLTQFIADITRRTVLVPDVAELSALGAVYAGLLGLNEVVSLADLERMPRKITEYHPVMPLENALQLYQGWQESVKRVL